MSEAPSKDTFWATARWLPQQVDLVYGQLLLLEIDERSYRESMFLDNRLAAREPRQAIVPLWPLTEAVPDQHHLRGLICHVGHCGSTLLSRILQDASGALCLREPLPLQAMAQVLREGDDPIAVIAPQHQTSLVNFFFSAFGRNFSADQPVITKATSNCSNLLRPFLAAHQHHRALFVYLRLEPFLATLLRSDLRRQETAGFSQSRLLDLHQLLGDDSIRLHELSPGELAAMSWAANMLWAVDAANDARLLPIDFEAVLDAPAEELAKAAIHLGLQATPAALDDAFVRSTRAYSKDPGMPYSRAHRDRELDGCRKQHAAEIERGLAWGKKLASEMTQAGALAAYL